MKNDLFYLRGSDCIEMMSFTVYNRWGEKVFEATDVTQGWDGKYNEELLEAGVYAYYIDAILTNGEIFNSKGYINLMR